MKIFPGIDTAKERRRFVVFHACTFVLCPFIGALVMFLINNKWPFDNSKGSWLIGSLFIWNVLGSWRFWWDSSETDGFFQSRLVAAVLLIGFPFVYFYNLWRVLFRQEGNTTE